MKKNNTIVNDEMKINPVPTVIIKYLLATTKIRTQEMASANKNEIRPRNLLLLMKNTNLLSLLYISLSSCCSFSILNP